MRTRSILKATAGKSEPDESTKRPARRSGGIAWNERNLDDNDAYLASTTRQKIDEPKTPYNGLIDMDAQEDDALLDAKRRISNEDAGRLLPSSDLDALTDEAIRRRKPEDEAPTSLAASPTASGDKLFAAKRSAHYDEFRLMKEMREKKGDDDEEDEDDK
ncbi:hypothetical protein T492DRAFT_1144234 [Pavlovales sp. CCMP2436]|nr:hypothetical protein T492DRAFT_1144234 [Pavlovales sp. CCMP2436]|mmetsp:Transcript_11171/g.28211  ORF Transcript_11171/g.28211 Transcript_11171/m.28211 type:complete len:160 (-) Transcript_11171:177-656(-)